MNRRTFLNVCGAVVATNAFSSAPRDRAQAIEPISRGGEPKFKFSLAAYSYRDLFRAKELTLSDFIADCASFGLEGTELTSYYFPAPAPAKYLRELKRECFLAGLDVSGTAVGNDFTHPPGQKRDQQIAHVKKWIDNAAILGAPVIRIFSGGVKGNASKEEAHRLAVTGIEECCEYAGQRGVHLALENHGGLTASPQDMLQIVRDVKSPWFGVNVDTGNFRTADVYGDLGKIAPFALNVQVKVVVRGVDGKKTPTDYKLLAKIMREAGYRGYIVLEYEEKDDPRQECPRYLDKLRTAFA